MKLLKLICLVTAIMWLPASYAQSDGNSPQQEFNDEIHNIYEQVRDDVNKELEQVKKQIPDSGLSVDADPHHGVDPGSLPFQPGNFMGAMVPIVAITFSLGAPVIIVALFLMYSHRKRTQRAELVAKFIDADREVPQELLQAFNNEARDANYLHSGLTLVGVGIGVLIALGILAGWKVGAIGLIPLFIGLARLLIWKISTNKEGEQSQQTLMR